jgi:hypothetical protein
LWDETSDGESDEEYQDDSEEDTEENDGEAQNGRDAPIPLDNPAYETQPTIISLYTGYSVNPTRRCQQHTKRISLKYFLR